MAPVFDPSVFDPSVFDAGSPDMAASGTFSMSGSASLQLTVEFDAVGTFSLAGAASLTTEILMAAAGALILEGEAELRTGKRAAILSECGGPLAADCSEWLLKPFQRS